jgi:alkylation response protein AidB-like acyl-CoA dehydrogenase
MWITNAGEAEIFLVFANIDPSKGYKGITCFIVEKEMGVQVSKKEKKVGSEQLIENVWNNVFV